MKIDSLSDLKKLIALCRKSDIEIIKVDNIELVLRDQPVKAAKRSAKVAINQVTQDLIDTPHDLSPEDLLFYSATGQAIPGGN